jgi:hypothetical protein
MADAGEEAVERIRAKVVRIYAQYMILVVIIDLIRDRGLS